MEKELVAVRGVTTAELVEAICIVVINEVLCLNLLHMEKEK
jgi:hypothetical protein